MQLEDLAKRIGLPHQRENSLRFVFPDSVFEITGDYAFYSTTKLTDSQLKADYLADQYPSNLLITIFANELDKLTLDLIPQEISIRLLDDSFEDLIQLIKSYSWIS